MGCAPYCGFRQALAIGLAYCAIVSSHTRHRRNRTDFHHCTHLRPAVYRRLLRLIRNAAQPSPFPGKRQTPVFSDPQPAVGRPLFVAQAYGRVPAGAVTAPAVPPAAATTSATASADHGAEIDKTYIGRLRYRGRQAFAIAQAL